MSSTTKILEGIGARLEVHPDRVIFRRTDMLAKLLPAALGAGKTIFMHEIDRVSTFEPEHLRLDDDPRNCAQLIITRKDHTSLSVRIHQSQCEEAQTIRSYITEQIASEYASHHFG
jgi:hypothetical protein